MIQDIAPHRMDNQYRAEIRPCAGDTLMVFDGQRILCDTSSGKLRLPRFGDPVIAGKNPERAVYLFSIDERRFFLMEKDDAADHTIADFPGGKMMVQTDAPGQFAFREVWRSRREIGGAQADFFAVSTALHLSHWYGNNRCCGRCGSRTVHAKRERALVCPSCGNMIYPRLVPAVIAAVTNGDELLVTKYGDRDLPFYALVAGFVEIGETLEECVAREVMEEVGLRVKNIRYYKSQPWGVVDDLLAGFFCEVDGDPTVHLDRTELKEGIWVKRGEVPLQPDHYSLTGEMMRLFHEGAEK